MFVELCFGGHWSQGWQTCCVAKVGLELLILLPLLPKCWDYKICATTPTATYCSVNLGKWHTPLLESQFCHGEGKELCPYSFSNIFYQYFKYVRIADLRLWITLRGRDKHFPEKGVEALKTAPVNTPLGNVRTGLEIYLSLHNPSISVSHPSSLSLNPSHPQPHKNQPIALPCDVVCRVFWGSWGREQGSAWPQTPYPIPHKSWGYSAWTATHGSLRDSLLNFHKTPDLVIGLE